jgi:hypothetical protein
MSVAVSPGFTSAGTRPQVGMGAGPDTEQDNVIVPEKPPCTGNANVSFACPPRLMLKFVAEGLIVKSGATLNVAVTVWSKSSATLQAFGSVPGQAPDQPPKMELADGTAVSATTVPLAKL